jgi:hypothetical protein
VWKCDDDPYFGATKLNKALFYSDFEAYRRLGAAITGAEYRALPHGPAPKQLLPSRRQMEQTDRSIAVQTKGNQKRVVALRDPNLQIFTASEIAVVDEVIEQLAYLDTQTVEDRSHGFLGWKAAMARSIAAGGGPVTIPYSTVFVSNPRLDNFQRAHLSELARHNKWFEPAPRSA